MFILFFLLWVVFNGKLNLEITLFGIVISGAMYWFICKYMDYSFQKDRRKIRKCYLAIEYVFVLVWEIIKANFQVIYFIMTSKYEMEPVLIRFHTDLKTDAARVALANSITLTPGTITVSLEDDEYCVHCLDKDLAKDIDQSLFVHMLQKMEAK